MSKSIVRFALVFGALVLVPASIMRAEIQWRAGPVALEPQSHDEIVTAIQALVPVHGSHHLIIQFDGPVGAPLREQLRAEGLTLLDYIGDNAYFAALSTPFANAAILASHQELKSVHRLDEQQKVHPDLAPGRIPTWAIVPPRQQPIGENIPEKTELDIGTVVAVYVKLHGDVALEPDGVRLCRQHGATVRSLLQTIGGLVVEMPLVNVPALAAEDAIEWVEPPLPKMGPVNSENRALVGANVAQAPPYNLTGAGVNVLLYDAGTALASHVDFGGRLSIRDSSPLQDHSTHVAGTIGGSGAASGGANRGMAPGVHIESYGFEQAGGLAQGFLYTDPGDLEADYGDAISAHAASLANNSIGSNVAGNGFPCTWEGDYGLTSSVIDSIARGSLGPPLPIIWAAGNERAGAARCGANYGTLAPPASSKNAICVGAVNSNDDSMTSFSSWGPTDDGRLKPDICAPGCQVGGDNGVTSCSAANNTAYVVMCGTSMATPTVTGISALLLQDFRSHYPTRPDFRNATLKAVLAQTAVDLGNPGPDFQFGYGSVRVVPAIDLMRSGAFVEGSLQQGGVYQAVIQVNPGETTLKATLAWDDPPAAPNVVTNLVNDLELRVYDPAGGVHFPWTLDPSNPAAPAVQVQADHLNNMEQVVINLPTPGVYRVEVTGFNLPQGAQTYSLCASPRLAACSSKGSIALGRSRYTCQDTATVQVVDCDLNANGAAIETVSAQVSSNTSPLGQMMTLTETGPNTATFVGTVELTSQSVLLSTNPKNVDEPFDAVDLEEDALAILRFLFASASGPLTVSDGDTLMASYVDANDGQGSSNVVVSDTAVLDCQGPVISNVQIASLGPRRATITFQTNEPAYGTVYYGTACAALGQAVSPGGIRTQHTINLTGLTETTTYQYNITAIDEAGNASMTPDSGNCLTFTTPVVPQFFTEIFESDDNDLNGHSLLFTPDGSPDYYKGCIGSITSLPTNPAGGTPLNMPDDGPPVPITLSGGATVLLYDQFYSTFYVSPNGYIVFNTPDTWFYETLEKHFLNPRISALFDDLDPTQGGSVSWKQMADHVAVTWINVPEWYGFNSNTFQVELFFDGRITINLLAIDALDGLTGLSAGTGLSPDFYETDLSASIPCDEAAPVAVNGAVTTPMNTAVDVILTANDEDEAALIYFITSLPSHGTLSDPLAGVINHVPYELLDHGRMVHYMCNSGFAGSESFQFQAADAYFLSNTGTVKALVGTPQIIYQFPFNSSPGWSTQGAWAFGAPQGLAGDPASAWTGSNVYGFNLAGAYPNNMATTQYLTTSAINCSTLAGTHLRFRRWLGVQAATGDHADVEISGAGSPWSPNWQHVGVPISDTSWSLVDLDVSGVADGNSTFRVRWGMGPTDGTATSFGWNIDDVEIWGILPGPCNSVLPGDVDLNGVVDGRDVAAFVRTLLYPAEASVTQWCAGDVAVDGIVDKDDVTSFVDLLLLK